MSLINSRYSKLNHWSTLTITALVALSTASLLQGCNGGSSSSNDCDENDTTGAYQAGKQEGSAAAARDWGKVTPQQRYDMGKQDGYNGGRQRGYNQGYNSAEGYAKGEIDGYNQGHSEGSADVYSCSSGSIAGLTDGYAEGLRRGAHDGYQDGYVDAYNFGHAVGQFSSCTPGAGADADQVNECKLRGYNDTYASAYAAAKASDADYKRGLKDGDTQGFTDGIAPGITAGYNAGRQAGLVRGRTDGKQQAYVDCYNAAFVEGGIDTGTGQQSGGVKQGYDQAYFSALVQGNNGSTIAYYGYGYAPAAPSISNGSGGAGMGFHDGFEDGNSLTCGYVPGASWYGFGDSIQVANGILEPWAAVIGGETVDVFAPAYSAYMSSGQAQAMDGQLAALRASLHTEARASSGF